MVTAWAGKTTPKDRLAPNRSITARFHVRRFLIDTSYLRRALGHPAQAPFDSWTRRRRAGLRCRQRETNAGRLPMNAEQERETIRTSVLPKPDAVKSS